MKRQFKLLAVTTLAVTMTSLSAVASDTCGRRRPSYGHHHSNARPITYRPTYRQPVYGANAIASPRFNSQPQRFASLSVAPAPVAPAPIAPAPVESQQSMQNPLTQVQSQANSVSSLTVQPAQTQVSVTEATPQQTDGTLVTTEPTALQLLESTTDDTVSTNENDHGDHEHTVATSTASGDHVGIWKVTLPGNQAVELNLADNGTFNWTATKNGKSSSFDGQFRMENDRLTLVRSSDLQQMAGSWTADGENFTFKLDGSTTGGLAFARN